MKEYVKVKLISRGSQADENSGFKKQFKTDNAIWGQCSFTFNPLEQNYDWLVIIDDLAHIIPHRTEDLRCPKENTILVTTEPSTIAYYGKAFAKQFHYLITNQNEIALPHSNALRSQTGNVWFYDKNYDEIAQIAYPRKTKKISTVCSIKQQGHTMHKLRYEFTQKMQDEIVELERFGRGFKWIEAKSEALDEYEFHVAIENHMEEHVWTEKLADAFLGWCVPIYCGCPNVYDYFPKESVIQIDIHDMEGSIAKIKEIIAREGEYEKRFEALKEARRRVLDEYNLLAMIDKIVQNAKITPFSPNQKIYSRRVMRVKHLPDLFKYGQFRMKNFTKNFNLVGYFSRQK